MMKNKFLFKTLFILGSAILGSSSAFAASYSDTENHWAEGAIDRWTEYSIVQGYGDKSFKPNGEMTRAELSQVIKKLLELKNTKGASFSDVNSDKWYYEAILACKDADIVEGKGENIFKPEDKVLREEAVAMIARALGIKEDEEITLEKYKDADEVSDWAKGLFSKLVSDKVVNGVSEDSLKPKSNVTRAQVLTVLNRAISNYITKDGEYEIKGDSGITLITAKDVTIRGNVEGELLIANGAEDAKLKLEDATVNGDILIKAEGASIELAEETEVKNISVLADDVTLDVDEKAKAEHIEVEAFELEANIEGNVSEINVTDKAGNTTIAGDGKVDEVNVRSGALNTTVKTRRTEVKTEEGSEGTVAGGKKVEAGKTVTTGSGSGGTSGGGTSHEDVKVSKITINASATNGDIALNEEGIYVFENYTIDSKINLSVVVEPENADMKDVLFEIEGDSATISEDGVITPSKTGTIIVKATAKDGSAVSQSITIRIAPEFVLDAKLEDIKSKLNKFESDYYNKNAGTVEFAECDNSNWFFEAQSILPLGDEDKTLEKILVEGKETENTIKVSVGNNNMLTADLFKFVDDKLNVALPIILLEDAEKINVVNGNLKITKDEMNVLSIESIKAEDEIEVTGTSDNWTIEFDKKFVKDEWKHSLGMKLAGIEEFDMKAHNYFTKKVKVIDGVESISYGFTSAEKSGAHDGLLSFYPALEDKAYTIEYTIASVGEELGIAKAMLNIGANGAGLLPKFEENVIDDEKILSMLNNFNQTFYNKANSGSKTYFELQDEKELIKDNWFIKINTKEAFKEKDKIEALVVNGIEFAKDQTQDISVGNNNFIKATM